MSATELRRASSTLRLWLSEKPTHQYAMDSALGDWLEFVAAGAEAVERFSGGSGSALFSDNLGYALTVARLINGTK